MSHSRIFQLKIERMTEDCFPVTADCFVENSNFHGPIADYTSNDCNRREDFNWLTDELKRVLGDGNAKYFSSLYADDGADMPEAYIIFYPGFKKAYMRKQYDNFIKCTGGMSLDNFMSIEYVRRLEEAICDKFGFYIAEDAYSVEPLDRFIRSLSNDEESKFWLWSTVDYHF